MNSPILFAVYLGGRHPKANIEVHDTVFAVGNSIEDCFETLKQKWFGSPKHIHIDSYAILNSVPGYRVQPGKTDSNFNAEIKLFYINLGASAPNTFEEIHQSGFYAAKNKLEAINVAKTELCKNFKNKHLDDALSVDDCLQISEIDNWQIVLIPDESAQKPQIVTKYLKLS